MHRLQDYTDLVPLYLIVILTAVKNLLIAVNRQREHYPDFLQYRRLNKPGWSEHDSRFMHEFIVLKGFTGRSKTENGATGIEMHQSLLFKK
ncbi:hypothetical protein D3C85_1246770 [compost metagenome]